MMALVRPNDERWNGERLNDGMLMHAMLAVVLERWASNRAVMNVEMPGLHRLHRQVGCRVSRLVEMRMGRGVP